MDAAQAETFPEDTNNNHQPAAEPAQPTSRICVKNLPKYVDENRLREHFSAKGEVTDAKIMRTRDGKSRCFGFIGFANADQAQSAVKYFDKSFMDSWRLVVEYAYQYGDSQGPRAWSKYTQGTSAHARFQQDSATGANSVPVEPPTAAAKKKRKADQQPKPEEQDPKLKEFLELMAPRSQKPIWANDDSGVLPPGVVPGATAAAGAGGKAGHASDDDDDLYEDLPHQLSSASDDEDGVSDGEEGGGADGGVKDKVVVDQGVSDMDYLKARMRRNFDDDADNDEDMDSDGESDSSGSESKQDGASSSDDEEENVEAKKGKAAKGANGKSSGDVFEAALKQAAAEDGTGDGPDDIDAIFGGDTSKLQAGHALDEDGEEGQPPARAGDDADEHRRDNNNPQASGRGRAGGIVDPEAVITQTGRLFVRNLPYTAGDGDLKALFELHGELEEVHVVQDRATRRSKGFAMIQFTDPESAVAAYKALDGSIFMGRLLHVLPGKAPPAPPEGEDDGSNPDGGGKGAGSSYKRQREAELKSGAGDNKVAWNSLFMRADTVAEAVAAHFGVSKAELLDRDAPDMAVRLALGETQVIAQTKKALGDAGVNIVVLEGAAVAAGKGSAGVKAGVVKRSDTVLLIKNLPYSVEEEELVSMFGAIGPLGRIVLPETHTLALVEYLESQDAKKAFRSLAYKRYQSVPLYLEWAPVGIFSGPPPPKDSTTTAAAAASKKKQAATKAATAAEEEKAAEASKVSSQPSKPGKATAEALATAAADDENVESSTIFVKNISFKTVDAGLTKHFEKAVASAGGALRSARVAKRKGPDGKSLSAGYGFVECSDEDTARRIIKALQGSSLDGHNLVLQLSQGKAATGSGAGGKGGKSKVQMPQQEVAKIAVRNVAFEATRKDILGLFTPFGHVKSCRLPRKFDGTPRGFAFVEFATPQEAVNAVEAVQGTHLYGRRLVIEWAEEDGGLDELRAKTAAKFRDDEEADPADRPSVKRLRA